MGLRFNKRVKICKGVTVNFGKKGASLSVGTKGYRKTFSKNGTRTTVGIPGTGLSYTDYKKHGDNSSTSKFKENVEKFKVEVSNVKDNTLLKEYKIFLGMIFSGFTCMLIGLFKVEFDFIALLLLIVGLMYMLINRPALQCQCAIYYYNKNSFDKSLRYCEKALNHMNVKENIENKANEIKRNIQNDNMKHLV